jgi:hypothetical protein
MDMIRRWAILILIGATVVVAYATGGRAAMVIETKGENQLMKGKSGAQVRTLQVLNEGVTLKVGKGAVLRLSFFKSGRKEKITGPCTIKLSQKSSEKTAGQGTIEVQKQRNASTDLDNSSNLRRTGGAMQANTGIVPENQLAFTPTSRVRGEVISEKQASSSTSRTTVAAAVVKPSPTSRQALEFVGLSQVYLTPEEAKTISWNQTDKVRVEIHLSDGMAYATMATGKSTIIPPDRLVRGQVHKAVLKGTQSTASQFFRIFSSNEARDYKLLVKRIKRRERHDPHALYSDLVYLNAQLGLLTRARATAKAALKQFPEDEGFRAVLDELDEKLGIES